MAKKKKEQMNSGQTEIRTPFREFVKNFKKQKTALVAAGFLISKRGVKSTAFRRYGFSHLS